MTARGRGRGRGTAPGREEPAPRQADCDVAWPFCVASAGRAA